MSNIEIDVNALSEVVNDKADRDLGNLTEEGNVKLGKGGLELCDIGMALYVDETKGLRRYLNGQIVDINTNTQAFLDRLLEIKNTNPDYFTTEDNWQAEALLNIDGCVYKFVLNYSGADVVSVRLPKYPDYVEVNAGGTLPVIGNGMNLGLTEGSRNFGLVQGGGAYPGLAGLTGNYGQAVGSHTSGNEPTTNISLGVTTDPTKSGLETTLKQTKLKMRYFIQIATGSETENNIINEIELNNPYSLFDSKYSDHELNNLSWLKSEGQWNAKAVYPTAYDKLLKVYNGTETVEGLSVKLSTETYTDYDFVLNTAEETFRLPLLNGSENLPDNSSDKITTQLFNSSHPYTATERVFVTGSALTSGGTGAGFSHVLLNGKVIAREEGDFADFQLILNKGDVLTTTGTTSDANAQINIAPVVGNGSLYFYVGETVQNANLIDAGRIGEQLATKTDMQQAAKASMPSNRYIDLTLGATGTTYIAPADGWISFAKKITATGQFVNLSNNTIGMSIMGCNAKDGSGGNTSCFISCKKGDEVATWYSAGGDVIILRFIYAEGAQ